MEIFGQNGVRPWPNLLLLFIDSLQFSCVDSPVPYNPIELALFVDASLGVQDMLLVLGSGL